MQVLRTLRNIVIMDEIIDIIRSPWKQLINGKTTGPKTLMQRLSAYRRGSSAGRSETVLPVFPNEATSTIKNGNSATTRNSVSL